MCYSLLRLLNSTYQTFAAVIPVAMIFVVIMGSVESRKRGHRTDSGGVTVVTVSFELMLIRMASAMLPARVV